jgi:2-dehydropantoate 2-reductase
MPRLDRIVIVGPGAMGCLHGALMAEAGLSVVLLDHDPERAWYLNQNGITLTFPDGSSRQVPVHCSADPLEMEPADLVLISVKAYHTATAIQWAAPVINKRTCVLTLQNGLGNYEILQQHVPPRQVLAGATSSGATALGPGRIRVAGIGETILGSPPRNKARAEDAAGCFSEAGLPVRVTTDVDGTLWRKAIINAALNPLGALTLRRNGELVEQPSLRRLLGKVAREAHQAALAVGMDLADLDPVAAVEEVCRQTAANHCSMLQDVLAGRQTEIRQINGEIVRRAREKRVRTPLNQALMALIEGMR